MRALLPIALLAACAAPDPDAGRDAVLHEWLLADNAVWRSRDPALLAGKYERMAADPYEFLRGTLGLFYDDAFRLGAERPVTSFVGDVDAATVLLVGDPHPENLGTLRPPTVVTGWGDLDAATWGPWVLDVRRAAQGTAVLAAGLDGCDEECALDAAEAVARGYAEGLDQASIAGGPAVDDLVDEATDEGSARQRLLDLTVATTDGRRLVVDSALDADGAGMLALDAGDVERVDAIEAAYDGGPGFRVLDAARRFGQGVSSWPAYRYILLVDRGLPGDDDDDLLNVREVLPAPLPDDPLPFDDDADRIRFASSTLWPADADPAADAVRVENQIWKVLTWSSWFQSLDHGKIGEAWDAGDLDAGNIATLGAYLGASLAQAHARGTTARGAASSEVITEDLAGRDDLLAQEVRATAAIDLARTQDDYDRFVAMLQEWGPWLGAETLLEEPQ